jgi:hypothetical protein
MKPAALFFIACRPQKEKNIAELYVVDYHNGGCIPLSCLEITSYEIVLPVTLKYLATNT